MWAEVHRPKRFSDFVGVDSVVRMLRDNAVQLNSRGEQQHLLFHGPPGSGKTSLCMAMYREQFPSTTAQQRPAHDDTNGGEDDETKERPPRSRAQVTTKAQRRAAERERIVVFNASQYRGVHDLRTAIRAVASRETKEAFKWVVLDEADALTHEAQSALRRLMEQHARVTRFVIICNYVDRLIPALVSRCTVVAFPALNTHDMKQYLSRVMEREHVRVLPKDATSIWEMLLRGGDLRRAVFMLQMATITVRAQHCAEHVQSNTTPPAQVAAPSSSSSSSSSLSAAANHEQDAVVTIAVDDVQRVTYDVHERLVASWWDIACRRPYQDARALLHQDMEKLRHQSWSACDVLRAWYRWWERQHHPHPCPSHATRASIQRLREAHQHRIACTLAECERRVSTGGTPWVHVHTFAACLLDIAASADSSCSDVSNHA